MTPAVPSVQHSFPGVVVHHGVVAVLVCELYVGVPLFSCLGVVSKVDGSGIPVVAVGTVDYSTRYESIADRPHRFCIKETKCRTAISGKQVNALCVRLYFGKSSLNEIDDTVKMRYLYL